MVAFVGNGNIAKIIIGLPRGCYPGFRRTVFMKFGTKAVHAGVEPDPSTGAIMTPIFQTSTYVQESPAKHKGYAYARGANPTRNSLQKSIAALENGKFGLCFSSGMGATDAVIKLLNPGDEVITSNDLYGGSYRMFRRVFEKYGEHVLRFAIRIGYDPFFQAVT